MGGFNYRRLKAQFPLYFHRLPTVADNVVLESTNRWIQFVKNQTLCPYVDTLGRNRRIMIEHSVSGLSLFKHAKALEKDEKADCYIVVLPRLQVPVFGQALPSIPVIDELVMGDAFADFGELHLGLNDPSDLQIVPVAFNPIFLKRGCWSPWPTVLFFKKAALHISDLQYYRRPGSLWHPIAIENNKTLAKIMTDTNAKTAFVKSALACYGDHIPTEYYGDL
jgi:hypothetical protein